MACSIKKHISELISARIAVILSAKSGFKNYVSAPEFLKLL